MKLYLKIDDTKIVKKEERSLQFGILASLAFSKKLIQVHTTSPVDLNWILLFQNLCLTQM